MKRLALVFAMVAIPVMATAKSLNPGYVGCLTKDGLDQFTRASVTKDERGMKYLIGKQCLFTAQLAEAEISILDQGIVTSKVRVYLGNEAFELVVPSEAVR